MTRTSPGVRLSLLIAFVLIASSALAAPVRLQVLIDTDNNASTGCRVITSLGNVDGIEAIATTSYDTDANGNTSPVLAPRLKMADLKGRALMIHAGGDNYADQPAPLGGGGVRWACGVIQAP